MAVAARPRWKGTLTLGLVSVPVQLFATADKKSLAPTGHNVHRVCMTQAKSKKVCEKCQTDGHALIAQEMPEIVEDILSKNSVSYAMDKIRETFVRYANVEIPEHELMKGYDVPPGIEFDGQPAPPFVELTEDDLSTLKVESTKVIRITKTAPASALEPLMISETSYLVSDGTAAAAEAEAVLVEALRDKIAVGTLVMSGRERPVAVMVYRGGFVLHVLRTADAMKTLPMRPALPPPDPSMVALAKQLVESMEGPLDLADTVDSYAEGMKELVRAKAGGEEVQLPPAAEPAKVFSLMDALKASVTVAAAPAEEKPAKPAKKVRKSA